MVEIFGLIVGSGIVAAAWKFFRRPRLRVYFDPLNTGDRLTTVVARRDPITIRQRAAWYHLHVANDGHRIATGCEGQVEQLEYEVEGEWQRHPDFRAPIPLLWANTNGKHSIDLHPGRTARLDIGCAVQGEDIFHFRSGMQPSGFIQAVSKGRYRLTVAALSGNAAAESSRVVLDHGGDWESVSITEPES